MRVTLPSLIYRQCGSTCRATTAGWHQTYMTKRAAVPDSNSLSLMMLPTQAPNELLKSLFRTMRLRLGARAVVDDMERGADRFMRPDRNIPKGACDVLGHGGLLQPALGGSFWRIRGSIFARRSRRRGQVRCVHQEIRPASTGHNLSDTVAGPEAQSKHDQQDQQAKHRIPGVAQLPPKSHSVLSAPPTTTSISLFYLIDSTRYLHGFATSFVASAFAARQVGGTGPRDRRRPQPRSSRASIRSAVGTA